MTTKKTRKAYAGTEVPVAKSREGVDKILCKWGATALQWEDDFITGNALLRFRWPVNGTVLQARLRLVAKQPTRRDARGQPRSPDALEKLRDAERRRLHRVAFHWLKAQADSIEAGLFEPSTVMLPFLEGGDGQTVAETLEPMLSRLGHGNLALSAGKER